jgi:murein L,D-transpeptidase YafK
LLASLILTALPVRAADAPLRLASLDQTRYSPTPDALIAKTLQDIRDNRLKDALNEVDRVISIRPDFKLAHLIRGDLLMARAKPLTNLGAVPKAPAQSLTDLRDEARARLRNYIDQPGPDMLPRQILRIASRHPYVLLADASRARLYLFENVDGEPLLRRDYYMTIGKNGTDKRVEGDKRTPMGVYVVSDQLPKKQLTDFYGAGAFPLNYPNEWDKLQGRGGHGIWLHGVPSDTYSRPPRSSDGCVVVSNPDLQELSQWVQPGVTPLIIAQRAEWLDRAAWQEAREAMQNRLETWKADWEARDPDRFLANYHADFYAHAGRGWAETKRRNIQDKDWIKVEVKDVSLFLYPGADMAYAEFEQNYTSDKHAGAAFKRLYWQKQDGQWRVVLERSQDRPTVSRYAQR